MVDHYQEPDAGLGRAAYPLPAGPLAQALGAIRWRWGRLFRKTDCGRTLEGIISELETLNRRTEEDFLAIGGKLMRFVTGARQLSSEMAALESIMSGCQVSQALSRVLEQSQQMETQAEIGERVLSEICDSARQIGHTFRGFQDAVGVFRVMGSLTRIETARLGRTGAEFGNLAEEVAALTQSIESTGQGIVGASEVLHQRMQGALAKGAALRASELKELPTLIAGITTSLESLEERHGRAVDVSLQQAAEYRKVSAAIEDLITAIQFHDITRQQIEHVADALKKLHAELKLGCRTGVAARRDARSVLTLQSSQLAHAEQVFASSAGRIEQDLEDIARRVRDMADTSKGLLGVSAEEQDSFFIQLERQLTGIAKVLGTCASAETETQGVLAELQETVGRMSDSVAEIGQIGIRIRRMAINAAIRAVQIGDAGRALNVIAEGMQRLAIDSDAITGNVARDLEQISGAADRLSGSSGKPSGTGDVLSEMHIAIVELHSSSDASLARLDQIAAVSRALGEDIQAVRSGFTAGELFAEAIRHARVALQEAAEQAEPHSGTKGKLDDFASQYTMQAERDVHESVVSGGLAERPAEDTAVAAADEDGLGDNVELF